MLCVTVGSEHVICAVCSLDRVRVRVSCHLSEVVTLFHMANKQIQAVECVDRGCVRVCM